MVRDITEKEKEIIINCGQMDYPIKKIAVILDIEESELSTDETFQALYQKGKALGEYVIDQKLFDMAIAGDLKALQKLEARKKIRNRSK